MGLYYFFGDRQPEPGAAYFSLALAPQLLERLEKFRQVFGLNAVARIPDRDMQRVAFREDVNGYNSFFSMRYRVAQKVSKHLHYLILVEPGFWQAGRHVYR